MCAQGPAFAIMGAFLIYQIQNKDVIPQDDFDNMIQKAIIATVLSCLLSNFGPIDDWLVSYNLVLHLISNALMIC